MILDWAVKAVLCVCVSFFKEKGWMLGWEWFLIHMESNTTQERRGSSEIGKGCVVLSKMVHPGHVGYVASGTLFTSLGLSLVIHKMG